SAEGVRWSGDDEKRAVYRPPLRQAAFAVAALRGPVERHASRPIPVARVDPDEPAVLAPGDDAVAIALGGLADAALQPVRQVAQRHAPAEDLLGQRLGGRRLPRLAVGGEQRRL